MVVFIHSATLCLWIEEFSPFSVHCSLAVLYFLCSFLLLLCSAVLWWFSAVICLDSFLFISCVSGYVRQEWMERKPHLSYDLGMAALPCSQWGGACCTASRPMCGELQAGGLVCRRGNCGGSYGNCVHCRSLKTSFCNVVILNPVHFNHLLKNIHT